MRTRIFLLQLWLFLLPVVNYAGYEGEQTVQAQEIITKSNYGGYEGEQAGQAQEIITKSNYGGEYYPVLEIPATHNQQGKADVYQDEYGVCVLINSKHLNEKLQKANAEAYPEEFIKPAITPHITLLQGVFRGAARDKLIDGMQKIAKKIPATEVVMADKFVKGGGGNTLLDVKDGKGFFDYLTETLTKIAPPSAPMKQVIDDIKKGEADLAQMYTGGAWRDFNIPGSNRPHITAVYSKQNDDLIETTNQLLVDQDLKVLADNIALVKIDERGNIYGNPIHQIQLSAND